MTIAKWTTNAGGQQDIYFSLHLAAHPVDMAELV